MPYYYECENCYERTDLGVFPEPILTSECEDCGIMTCPFCICVDDNNNPICEDCLLRREVDKEDDE